MNILVPLAGKDESFVQAYGDLKPLININGQPLIATALSCLPYSVEEAIFICLREHEERFVVGKRLRGIFGDKIRVVYAEEATQGSACSALLAEEYIDNDESLLIDLADIYFVPLDLSAEISHAENNYDGLIPICRGRVQNRPWGYVYFDADGCVAELKEKEIQPSGDDATLGLYFFSRGADFIKYTKRMIDENKPVPYNDQYYVGPVYNWMIEDGRKVTVGNTEILDVLGSVEDVESFVNTKAGSQVWLR